MLSMGLNRIVRKACGNFFIKKRSIFVHHINKCAMRLMSCVNKFRIQRIVFPPIQIVINYYYIMY